MPGSLVDVNVEADKRPCIRGEEWIAGAVEQAIDELYDSLPAKPPVKDTSPRMRLRAGGPTQAACDPGAAAVPSTMRLLCHAWPRLSCRSSRGPRAHPALQARSPFTLAAGLARPDDGPASMSCDPRRRGARARPHGAAALGGSRERQGEQHGERRAAAGV